MKTNFNKDLVMTSHNLAVCLKRNWEVFCIVAENPNINVTDVYVKMRKDQSTASKKLAELRGFGLVEDLTEGKREATYAITDKAIRVVKGINSFVK